MNNCQKLLNQAQRAGTAVKIAKRKIANIAETANAKVLTEKLANAPETIEACQAYMEKRLIQTEKDSSSNA